MAVSQKQIAEKLGVSIALVSRVLSGKAAEIGIAPATVQRVLTTAKQLGYVPSAAALSLKGKSTRTVGVVVYDFMDPFFGLVIRELQRQALTQEYTMVLTGFLHRTPDPVILQPLHKHAIDGLIIIGTDLNAIWLETFSGLPAVRIGHAGEKEQSLRINTDDADAARQLLERTRKKGCRAPAFIGADLSAHRLRAEAFKNVAGEMGLDLRILEASTYTPFDAGKETAYRALQSVNRPDLLLCATDQVAMGALHALQEAGLNAPKQIRVTGFDDIPAAEQFLPPITTIRQPIQEMTRQALLAMADMPDASSITLSGQLMARISS